MKELAQFAGTVDGLYGHYLDSLAVHFVNGDLQQWADSPALLTKLDELRSRGLEGKALVHELLTDDWGAPPLR